MLRLGNLEILGGEKSRTAVPLLQRADTRIYYPVYDDAFMHQLLPGAGLDGDEYAYGAFGLVLNPEKAPSPRARSPAFASACALPALFDARTALYGCQAASCSIKTGHGAQPCTVILYDCITRALKNK